MSILVRGINLFTKSGLERAKSPHTSNWGLRRIWLKAFDRYHSNSPSYKGETQDSWTKKLGKHWKEKGEAFDTMMNAEAELARRLKSSKMPEVLLTTNFPPSRLYVNVLGKLNREELSSLFRGFSAAFLVLTWRGVSLEVISVLDRGGRVIMVKKVLEGVLKLRGINPENWGDLKLTSHGWQEKKPKG